MRANDQIQVAHMLLISAVYELGAGAILFKDSSSRLKCFGIVYEAYIRT